MLDESVEDSGDDCRLWRVLDGRGPICEASEMLDALAERVRVEVLSYEAVNLLIPELYECALVLQVGLRGWEEALGEQLRV